MYSFINFQIDDTVVLTIVIMLYIKYALKTQSRTLYYIVINLKISKREQERYILISEVDKLWGGH